MKSSIIFASPLLGLLLTACWQKSVHPFYRDQEVLFEPALVGTWRDPAKTNQEQESWTFSRDGDKTYRLTIHNGDSDTVFDARLFKLASTQLLDLQSRNRSICDIPAHTLLRIGKIGETVELQLISPGYIKEWLKQNPKSLSHIRVTDPEHPDDREKDEIVLTAETDTLQKFLREHLEKDGFFEEAERLTKTK